MFADSCASWALRCVYCRASAEEVDDVVDGRDCLEPRGDDVDLELVDIL